MTGVVQALRPGTMTAAGDGMRVLLIVEPSTPTLLNTATGWGKHRLTVDSRGLAAASAASPGLRQADVAIVEVDPEDPASLDDFTRFIRDVGDALPVIAAVRDLTVAATRLALRSGATDVLPLQFSAADLDGAIAPVDGRLRPTATAAPAPRGKIVAFLGATGGCGTTALAVQTGIIWAATTRVCVIDLDLQFGTAALYLDLGTQLGLADILDAGTRLDVDLMRTIAQTHSSGLNVIASPADILPLDAVTPEAIDKILTLAAQAFDIVIVDLPGAWTAWSMRAVEVADLTMLVTSLTVPGIHQGRRQSEIIAANGFGERLRVIVNRIVHPMFGTVDLSETQSLLGRKIDFAIANDYPTVSGAIDRGKTLAAVKSKSRIEKDLRTMAEAISVTLRAEVAA